MAIVGKNYVLLTANGIHNTTTTSILCNESVPTDTGDDWMAVVTDASGNFEIMKVTASSGNTLTVVRAQESTGAITIPDDGVIVCELTHETLDDVYGELLAGQKTIGPNAGTNPSIDADNQINVNTTDNKVYIAAGAAWVELCRESHADYTNLTSSTDHTQYYTSGRADTWHDNLADDHLTAVAHAHSGSGTDGDPAANMRDLASEPADTVTGGVYYNTTNKTIYYYSGGWQQYNTVPQYAMIFRDDGSCPDGWTEKTSWNGYFLKGETAATWTGGTGGANNHTHDVSDVPAHAHTIPDRDVTVAAVSSHTHSITTYLAGGTDNRYTRQTYNNQYSALTTTGSHSHTVTVAQHNTNSAGTSSASSQSTSSFPKYVQLTLCEKD